MDKNCQKMTRSRRMNKIYSNQRPLHRRHCCRRCLRYRRCRCCRHRWCCHHRRRRHSFCCCHHHHHRHIGGLGGPVVRPLAAHAKGLRFNSPIAKYVQRLIFCAFMYGTVGSLVLRWSWARQLGFISFRCLWIQLCNNLRQRLCVYNLP